MQPGRLGLIRHYTTGFFVALYLSVVSVVGAVMATMKPMCPCRQPGLCVQLGTVSLSRTQRVLLVHLLHGGQIAEPRGDEDTNGSFGLFHSD